MTADLKVEYFSATNKHVSRIKFASQMYPDFLKTARKKECMIVFLSEERKSRADSDTFGIHVPN